MKWLGSLPTVETRIVTNFGLLAAVAFALGPDFDRPFSIEKAIPVAVAAVAWIFAELRDIAPPSGHDIRLLHLIENNLNAGCLHFLRHHDFGAAFSGESRNGLGEMTRWHGAQYTFSDKKIDAVWQPLKSTLSDFETLLAVNSGPLPKGGNFFSVFPGHHVDKERHTEIERMALRLNNEATDIVARIGAFQLLARKRLKQ